MPMKVNETKQDLIKLLIKKYSEDHVLVSILEQNLRMLEYQVKRVHKSRAKKKKAKLADRMTSHGSII